MLQIITMMATKRNIDHDPDYEGYEEVTDRQNKRQKVLEQDAKEATVKKIESIIKSQFSKEMKYKQDEIDAADQRIYQAKSMLDRLRACIIAKYYSTAGQPTNQVKPSEVPVIHPTVKKIIGKTVNTEYLHPDLQPKANPTEDKLEALEVEKTGNKEKLLVNKQEIITQTECSGKRGSRFKTKRRIIVGNVSKYIPRDKRDENDQATHKWMVYVRGPQEEPHIDHFVKKVWFFLHPSYRPNDLVEINQPPFHLTRRGWGEFPVRVQLHFKDSRNKRVDIIHNLKLDRTYTGLQTLGAETVVDVELEKETVKAKAKQDYKTISTSKSTSPNCLEVTVSHDKDENLNNNETENAIYVSETVRSKDKVKSSNVNHESLCRKGCEILNESNGNVRIKEEPMEIDMSVTEYPSERGQNGSNSSPCSSQSEINRPRSSVNLKGDFVKNLAISDVKRETLDTIESSGLSLHQKLCSRSSNVNSNPDTLMQDNTAVKHKTSVLQPNTVYVRCVDSQGKLYLVPQRLVPKLIGTVNNTQTQKVSAIGGQAVLNKTTNETAITQVLPSNIVKSETPDSGVNPGQGTAIMRPAYHKNGSGNDLSLMNSTVGLPTSRSLLNLSNLHNQLAMNKPNTSNQDLNCQNTKTPAQASQGNAQSLVLLRSSTSGSSLLGKTSLLMMNSTTANQHKGWLSSAGRSEVVHSSTTTDSSTAKQVIQIQINSNPNEKQISSTSNVKYTIKNGILRPTASVNSPVTMAQILNRGTGEKSFLGGTSGNLKLIKKKKSEEVEKPTTDTFIKRIKDRFSKCMQDFEDVESLVQALVKHHPLLCETVDKSILPYCAKTEDDYFKWNIGKRRAAEWTRACAIRKQIMRFSSHQNVFNNEPVWSTKKIMMWCRTHSYTPLDKGIVQSMRFKASYKQHLKNPSSYTCVKSVMDEITALEMDKNKEYDSDVELVDVTNSDEMCDVKIKTELSPEKKVDDTKEFLPPTPEAEFVQDTVHKLGIQFRPSDITPGVAGSVVEDMIWAATKELADNMIRRAIATHCDYQGYPSDLNIEAIYRAILSTDKFDILTNALLGEANDKQPGTKY